jgi:vitamin B12/bleomycin/antimicrobial peptide transport system ATP-binding/permease protein
VPRRPGAALAPLPPALRAPLPPAPQQREGASLRLDGAEPVVLTGPSGSGKSTFFRAISGIWRLGAIA